MEETERKPRFTNVYTTDAETDKQLYRSISLLRRVLLFTVMLGFIGYFIYLLIDVIRWSKYTGQPVTGEMTFWLCIAGFAMYLFIIVRELLGTRLFVKRQAKRLREVYDKDSITIDAAFFDDKITFHNLASDANLRLPYTALKSLSETKDLFLMKTQQRQVIALGKHGFTGTDAAGFRAFMDEKCPNIRRRWSKDA